MINLEHICASYGTQEVLHEVDLQADEGELVACVGPSGSGKTTLLSVIAGLLTPDEGRVEVAGVHLNGSSQRARAAFRRENLAFIFQSFNLIPYLTAAENVEIPLYLCGAARRGQRARAEDLLDRVGLAGKAGRLPSQLSVGEQQRVAIARSLANEPRVLLADEPTGNLDRRTGRKVLDDVRAATADGVTVILVTHDPEVADLADRRVILVDGRLQS